MMSIPSDPTTHINKSMAVSKSTEKRDQKLNKDKNISTVDLTAYYEINTFNPEQLEKARQYLWKEMTKNHNLKAQLLLAMSFQVHNPLELNKSNYVKDKPLNEYGFTYKDERYSFKSDEDFIVISIRESVEKWFLELANNKDIVRYSDVAEIQHIQAIDWIKKWLAIKKFDTNKYVDSFINHFNWANISQSDKEFYYNEVALENRSWTELKLCQKIIEKLNSALYWYQKAHFVGLGINNFALCDLVTCCQHVLSLQPQDVKNSQDLKNSRELQNSREAYFSLPKENQMTQKAINDLYEVIGDQGIKLMPYRQALFLIRRIDELLKNESLEKSRDQLTILGFEAVLLLNKAVDQAVRYCPVHPLSSDYLADAHFRLAMCYQDKSGLYHRFNEEDSLRLMVKHLEDPSLVEHDEGHFRTGEAHFRLGEYYEKLNITRSRDHYIAAIKFKYLDASFRYALTFKKEKKDEIEQTSPSKKQNQYTFTYDIFKNNEIAYIIQCYRRAINEGNLRAYLELAAFYHILAIKNMKKWIKNKYPTTAEKLISSNLYIEQFIEAFPILLIKCGLAINDEMQVWSILKDLRSALYLYNKALSYGLKVDTWAVIELKKILQGVLQYEEMIRAQTWSILIKREHLNQQYLTPAIKRQTFSMVISDRIHQAISANTIQYSFMQKNYFVEEIFREIYNDLQSCYWFLICLHRYKNGKISKQEMPLAQLNQYRTLLNAIFMFIIGGNEKLLQPVGVYLQRNTGRDQLIRVDLLEHLRNVEKENNTVQRGDSKNLAEIGQNSATTPQNNAAQLQNSATSTNQFTPLLASHFEATSNLLAERAHASQGLNIVSSSK